MSLLLDALKSAPSATPPDEPEEEPLDPRATLELLIPKSAANETMALEPSPDTATTEPAIEAPGLVSEIAPPSILARDPLTLAGATPESVAPQPSPMPTTNARARDGALPPVRRSKKYGLLLVALVALAAGALVVKIVLRPSTNAVVYPEGGEGQPPAANTDPTPTPSSTHAVQVSSARPADQFAYTGDAPEIDLRATDAPLAATKSVAGDAASASVVSPISDEPEPATPGRRAREIHTAAPTAAPTASRVPATLSVTRSEGLSSIDRHVQAGYRALGSGNGASAQTEYLAALELDPNNVDGLMGSATIAARNGNSAAAAAAYAKVLKLEPGNPDATAAMTMLRSNGAASESDESRLKILIAGDDGSRPVLHAALGGVYAADARWTEAAQEYFTALSKDPGNPDMAFNVAASLDQNRNAAMALKFYQQAMAFARQRPAQIDLHAVEQRINQLKARVEVPPSGAAEAP
jgi:Flp pilus assembly protein TadD